MLNKKLYFLVIFVSLFSLNVANAAEVICGFYAGDGNYMFITRDSVDVQVTIDNKFSNIQILPSNTFILTPGESKIVSFRSQYGDIAVKFFVTYADQSASASLECNFFATQSEHPVDPPTTTTTIPTNPCSGKVYTTCNSLPNCVWVGDFRIGYCEQRTVTTSTTTTTTIPQTTTTLPQTTTTQPTTTTTIPANSCSGKSFSYCNSPKCEWTGDPRFGYCRSKGAQTTTTTIPQTTTTLLQTTTTVPTTTTTTIPTNNCSGKNLWECVFSPNCVWVTVSRFVSYCRSK